MTRGILFLLFLSLCPLAGEKIQTKKRNCILFRNETGQTLAIFHIAVHWLPTEKTLVRMQGYAFFRAGEEGPIGWDFFPCRIEKIDYFIALFSVDQDGCLLHPAFPLRHPCVFLPLPYLPDASPKRNLMLDRPKYLSLKHLFLLNTSDAHCWKAEIKHYFLSLRLKTISAPFLRLRQEDTDSLLIAIENTQGEIFYRMKKKR